MLPGLLEAEGGVEEGSGTGETGGASRPGGGGGISRHEIPAGRLVPEPDAGGEANGALGRIPDAVGDEHLDLAAPLVDRHLRRRPDRLGVPGANQVRTPPVHGEEERRRPGRVGPVGEVAVQRGAADRDRGRNRSGILEGVQGDPEGGRVGEWLDPELDQVGSVVGVDRVGRIRVGAVGLREGVVAGAGVARVATFAAGAVVVVEEVLVEELALAVGARAGDQDRVRAPDAAVLELRRLGERAVEDVGAGARGRPLVQRAVCGGRPTPQRDCRRHTGEQHSHPPYPEHGPTVSEPCGTAG